MKSGWKKIGRIYCPNSEGRHSKLLSHAANPLPVHIEGDVYRVFYSGRDELNRSSVGAVDIDIVKGRVIYDHKEPFFCHGPEGSYYADGVSIGNCYIANGVQYMLFMGWQSPKDRHWRGDIGRLVVRKDLTLELEGDEPFMGVDNVDPISLSYPWVNQEKDGSYTMWYGSTLTWDAGNREMLHVINFATSCDGDQWKRHGLAVPYELGVAQAFSRPTVIYENGSYEMWFSFRSGSGEKYRIGRAVSCDGKVWRWSLKDRIVSVSDHGWDSEMVEYPYVFMHGDLKYMIYNGNSFGATGFGLALMHND
jgi:hypothetical protein